MSLGWSREELIGQRYRKISTPASIARGEERTRRGLAGEKLSPTFEAEMVRKDGNVIVVDIQDRFIHDSQGAPIGFQVIFRDITERRRMEEALRESEEQYRLLFDRNPHSMWVYDLDTLAFLAVNDATVHHYGYTRDEFLAMTIMDICPPDDASAILARVSTVTGLAEPSIWRHRKKDGSPIEVEITSHTLNFSGRHARVVLANDITARRRAEAALRESQECLRTVITGAPIILFATDHEGVFTLSEGKGLEALGRTPGESVGRSVFHFPGNERVIQCPSHLSLV